MVNSRYFSSIAVRQYLANAEMHLLVRVFGYTYNRNKSITLPFLSAVSNAVVCHNIQYYFIVYIYIYIIWRGEKYKLARSQALQCSIAVVPWLQFFFRWSLIVGDFLEPYFSRSARWSKSFRYFTVLRHNVVSAVHTSWFKRGDTREVIYPALQTPSCQCLFCFQIL